MHKPEKTGFTGLAKLPEGNPYYDATLEALGLLLDAGLKTYGQMPGVDSWSLALGHRGIMPSEFGPAVAAFSSGECGVNFPSAGEFCNWIIARREDEDRRAEIEQALRLDDERREREREEFKEILLRRYGTATPLKDGIGDATLAIRSEDALKQILSPDRSELIDHNHAEQVKAQLKEAKGE